MCDICVHSLAPDAHLASARCVEGKYLRRAGCAACGCVVCLSVSCFGSVIHRSRTRVDNELMLCTRSQGPRSTHQAMTRQAEARGTATGGRPLLQNPCSYLQTHPRRNGPRGALPLSPPDALKRRYLAYFIRISPEVKSSLYINNRQPYGSLSNVLRKPAGEDGSLDLT